MCKWFYNHRSIIILVIAALVLFGAFCTLKGIGHSYPKPVGYVNDFANLMTPDERITLGERIKVINTELKVLITIVTVQSLEGQDAETYARNIGNEWGVQDKEMKNGLILLIAPNEKKWFFKTGYGMEAALPDSALGSIGRNTFVPLYRQKRVYDAFNATLTKVANDIERYQAKEQKKTTVSTTSPSGTGWLVPVLIILGFGIISIISLSIFGQIITSIFDSQKRKRARKLAEERAKTQLEARPLLILPTPVHTRVASAAVSRRKEEPRRETKKDDDEPRRDTHYHHEEHHEEHHDSGYDTSSHDSGGFDFGGGGGGFGGGGAGGDL